jgi:hypothetical protein
LSQVISLLTVLAFVRADDCVVHRQAEQVLDRLAALAAVGMAEESVATTFSSMNIGQPIDHDMVPMQFCVFAVDYHT